MFCVQKHKTVSKSEVCWNFMLWIRYFSFFMIFRPLNIHNGPSGDRDISSSAQNKSPALPKRFWWDSATVFLVQGAITFKIPLISWNHHFRANGSYRNTCNKNFAHIARRIEKLKFTNLLTNRKSVQPPKSSGLVKVFWDPEELTRSAYFPVRKESKSMFVSKTLPLVSSRLLGP